MAAPLIAVIRYASGPRADVNWRFGPRNSGRSALTDELATVGKMVSARAAPVATAVTQSQVSSGAGAFEPASSLNGFWTDSTTEERRSRNPSADAVPGVGGDIPDGPTQPHAKMRAPPTIPLV